MFILLFLVCAFLEGTVPSWLLISHCWFWGGFCGFVIFGSLSCCLALGVCHDLSIKLSPHSSEPSPLHCMYLTPSWPGSAGDPNHPQLFPTMHWVSLSLPLGLGPRHLSDHNPSASGTQTPLEITWTSCDNFTTTCHMNHPCHLVGSVKNGFSDLTKVQEGWDW